MKTIVAHVISVLVLMGLVTAHASISASAQTSGGTARGSYRFVLEDDLSKYVEFEATSNGEGTATGLMTFRDEARIVEQDVDGIGGHEEGSASEFYMTAFLDSLTIDRNRAVMGGTITDSSNRSYIGRWVQLVVEDNGDGGNEPDKLSWCFCQREERGWVPADAEVRDDQGAYMQWWATDAEQKDDVGVQSTNFIPGDQTGCKVFPLPVYSFADVRSGEGQILVQP